MRHPAPLLATWLALLAAGCSRPAPLSPEPTAASAVRFALATDVADDSLSVWALDAASGGLRLRDYRPAGSKPVEALLHPGGRFAYVLHSPIVNSIGQFPPGGVLAYELDPATGRLAELGAVAVGRQPGGLVLDLGGHRLYATSQDGLFAFTIGADGRLSAVAGSPFPTTGSGPLAFGPGGRFAYQASAGGVVAWSVDAGGALAALTGSPFGAGMSPGGLGVDPAAGRVFVANLGSQDVSVFRIDATTGALLPVAGSPFPAGGAPGAVLLGAGGRLAFSLRDGQGGVAAWTVDAATGALSPLPGPTLALPAGSVSRALLLHPGGGALYLLDPPGAQVHGWAVAPDTGAFTALPGAPWPVPATASALALDPTGSLAVVTLGASDRWLAGETSALATFAIDPATRALHPLGTSAGRRGSRPAAFAVGSPALRCAPRFAYVAHPGSGLLSAFAVDPERGTLAPVAGSPFAAGGSPVALAAGGDAWLWGALGDGGKVGAWAVDPASGALTAVAGSPFGCGAGGAGMAVAAGPAGRTVYAATGGAAGALCGFAVDPASGALSPLPSSPMTAPGGGLALAPGGGQLFASSSGISAFALQGPAAPAAVSGSPFGTGLYGRVVASPAGPFLFAGRGQKPYGVAAFSIAPATGALAALPQTDFGGFPGDLVVDPRGKWLYAAADQTLTQPARIEALAIDPDSGALAAVPGAPFGAGAGAAGLAVDPSGTFLFATERDAARVHAFAIQPFTGALVPVPGSPFAVAALPGPIAVVGSCR